MLQNTKSKIIPDEIPLFPITTKVLCAKTTKQKKITTPYQ